MHLRKNKSKEDLAGILYIWDFSIENMLYRLKGYSILLYVIAS
jgi:hypothetical protein